MQEPNESQPRRREGEELGQLWVVVRRHRKLVLLTFAVTVALAALYTWRATPVYEAFVSVRIQDKQTAIPVLDALKTLTDGSEFGTEMEVLASRTLMEDVVDSLRLQVRVTRPRRIERARLLERIQVSRSAPKGEYVLEQGDDGAFVIRDTRTERVLGHARPGERVQLPGASFTLAAAAGREPQLVVRVSRFADVVEDLQETIEVERAGREAKIAFVYYRDTDRRIVREVPNVLAARFIARRQHIKHTEARSTVHFLRGQIELLAAQLHAAEEELRAFRREAEVIEPKVEATTQLTALAELQAQRIAIEAERGALAGLLEEIRAHDEAPDPTAPSPYRRLIGFPSILRNQAAGELLRSVVAVENQRAELLARRTLDDPDVQVLTGRIHALERELRVVAETYLQGLTNQVASLDVPLTRFRDQLERIPDREIQLARLMREPKVLEEIYILLQTRLKEAEIAQAVEDPSVRVVDPAIMPRRPVRPNPLLNLFGAAAAGLALGIAGALFRAWMDRAVRSRDDVRTATGLPVLALIPALRGGGPVGMTTPRLTRIRLRLPARLARATGADGGGQGDVVNAALVRGGALLGVVDAAYSRLQTNIAFARQDRAVRTIVMTSALPGDGKSTTSANFALTLARCGRRVLLIDSDLHRGLQHTYFHVPREPGFTEVLAGKAELRAAVCPVDAGAGKRLDFLPTGALPHNPTEALGSPRLRALLERMVQEYDIVVIDSPPLNAVSDAALLGAAVDGVVLVARSGVTPVDALTIAADQLRHVRAPVLGTVLNDIDFDRDAAYDGAYVYYRPDRYPYVAAAGG